MAWTDRYSNFPSEIDTFIEHFDIQYEDLSDVSRYQYLKTLSYLTEVQQVELSALTNKLRDKIWFSEDINRVMACMVNLETFFRDNTIPQLEQYKNELKQFAQDYQKLTQLKFQAWTTTSSKDYDIHSGVENIDASVELTVDSPANVEVVIDGVQIGYNNYTIAANSTGKKSIIRFNSSFSVPTAKRLECRWQDTSGRVFSVSSHSHQKSDIPDLPNVAKTGSYADLLNLPSEFVPAYHTQAWGTITGKPSTFPPSAHDHHTSYYTKSEMDTKLSQKSATGHKHVIADITGLQEELNQVKSSVSNGKQLVATAITDKGISASGGDSFETLANKVNQIEQIKSKFDLYEKFVRYYASTYNSSYSKNPPGMVSREATPSGIALKKGFVAFYSGGSAYPILSGDVSSIPVGTADNYGSRLYKINTTATIKSSASYNVDFSYIDESGISAYIA